VSCDEKTRSALAQTGLLKPMLSSTTALVWRDKIAFRKLNLPNPRKVPVGPSVVIDDDIGFSRQA